MDHSLAAAKTQAERHLVGRGHIVGVALASRPDEQLVFFLDRLSAETERRVSQWARTRGVEVAFRVVGGFRPLV